MLLALVLLLGLVVLILLLIWLTNRIFLRQTAVPVELIELGTGEGPLGGGKELAEPLDEDVPVEERPVEQTLAVIADAVAVKAAQLADPTLASRAGRGTGGGAGSGSGVHRDWRVDYIRGNTLETYARQLDFFGIELAVVLPGNKLVYAFNLRYLIKDTRSGVADQEKRYYLTWLDGELGAADRELEAADRELLSRAGIQSAGRIIVKLLPLELERQMAGLERAYAGRDAREIRKTRFEVRPDEAGGYRFVVVDQSYKY